MGRVALAVVMLMMLSHSTVFADGELVGGHAAPDLETAQSGRRLSVDENPPLVAPIFVPPQICRDRDELAGIVKAEANVEPYQAQLAIAQIVVREAGQRGLTICALDRLTNFVSVRHYAQAHPNSWTAWALAHPDEEHYAAADDALLGLSPPALPGLYHFDGASHGDAREVVLGSVVFRP